MNYMLGKQNFQEPNNTHPKTINGKFPPNIVAGMNQMSMNSNVNTMSITDHKYQSSNMPIRQNFPDGQELHSPNNMVQNAPNPPFPSYPNSRENQMAPQPTYMPFASHPAQMPPPPKTIDQYQQNIVPKTFNSIGQPLMDPVGNQSQVVNSHQQNMYSGTPMTMTTPPPLQQGFNGKVGMPPSMKFHSGPVSYSNNQMMSTIPNQQAQMYNANSVNQQSLQRRLDPDHMPNPIQVMIENQKTCGGVFYTNQAGLLPPLVTTKFVTQDQGNSSPRLVRCSLYCVPNTADLLKTTALPFSVIVSPFAKIVEGEMLPPKVDFGELGPIRCIRCKAYMSPNMQFIDAGRRFVCVLCKATTDVPIEYFQHLDHTGQRVDKYERPELVLGTYEFVATKDYCRDNIPPKVPAFVFIIDVSYNNMKSGLVHLFCQEIKEILKHLPIDQGQNKSSIQVGFITYNNVVHFYNLKNSLTQPQMMIVGDLNDMFMPLLDGFLCDPEESSVIIDALMEQIPKMFHDTKETETILLPAVNAGLEALQASNCAGKLFVFNSSLPIVEAPGKLKNRDDRKVLGTDKEKSVLVPQSSAYEDLAKKAVQSGCSIDLFIFNNSYIDLATIGQLCKITGGEIFKYTYFQADVDGQRLVNDIIKNISRPIGFDTVMRVRTSAGIRPTDFYGHFHMSNTTDMEIASIDCDKAIAFELKHDDKLSPEENVYIQIALLFTSCSGERRLRIINLALPTTTTIAEVFKSCDLDAIVLYFAKQAMQKLLELSPKLIKESLIRRSAQVLACYRKHCTSPTSAGQLILPECLKLLPLYISCLLKNDAISGGADMTCDDRSFAIQYFLSLDLPASVSYIYPRLIPIHNVNVDETNIPNPVRTSHEKMSEDGAYILENGIYLFIWLGLKLSTEFTKALFGVQCTQQVNTENFNPQMNTALSVRICNILDLIMAERKRHMRITVVRQQDKLENVLKHFLVEDRGADGSASYVDFLCHMHKEIKDLLN